MADDATTVDNTSTAYVVYVPPSGTDKTVESCLRLGVGPSASTTDEWTTYSDFVSGSDALSGLSSSTYNTDSGITLVTPGAIHLLAAGGVNTTSGSYTNSTIGSSYAITQDPKSKEIVSATYTNNNYGLWTTASFSQQASNVAVNTIPLQAALQLGVSYSLSGPLSFANSSGASFNSFSGWSVSAQLAHSVAIGWRTAVSYSKDGSSNEYYSAAQATSTGASFSWTVPVAGLYTAFDTMQQKWCKLVNAGALATNAVAAAYAVSGASIALGGSPSDVQTWLKGAEPIAIICSTLNAILGAMGYLLGYLVDLQAVNPLANVGATTFALGSGRVELKTEAPAVRGSPAAAPVLTLDATGKQIVLSTDDLAQGTKLLLDGATGTATLGKAGAALITLSNNSLVLEFGTNAITLNANGILVDAGGHSVNVTNNNVAIAGQQVTIEGAMAQINALETTIGNAVTGLAAAHAAAQAASLAAAAAANVAALTQQQLNDLLNPPPPPPIDPAIAAIIYT